MDEMSFGEIKGSETFFHFYEMPLSYPAFFGQWNQPTQFRRSKATGEQQPRELFRHYWL